MSRDTAGFLKERPATSHAYSAAIESRAVAKAAPAASGPIARPSAKMKLTFVMPRKPRNDFRYGVCESFGVPLYLPPRADTTTTFLPVTKPSAPFAPYLNVMPARAIQSKYAFNWIARAGITFKYGANGPEGLV